MTRFPEGKETETEIRGLCAAEVEERIRQGKDNRADVGTGLTIAEIIRSNTFTYFNFIFLVITILLCLVGSFRNLTFLPIIIANTLIGIIQEIRAKKTIDKLAILTESKTVVLREGKKWKIST